jgi:hypothetical protein
MSDRLDRAFTRAVRNRVHNEGRPAKLGNTAGIIYAVLESGATHGVMVHVRYDDSSGAETAEAIVYNTALPAVYDLPVMIVERKGKPTAVIDQFDPRWASFLNNGGWMPITQHQQTHRKNGTDPRYVEGLMMEPLLVKPSSPVALTVYVMAGWYNWNGNEDVWEGGDSGSLSAYVPGSAGTIHFILICLNSSTNAIVIVDGADKTADFWGVGGTVGYSDIEAISINADYIPLAVVELENGQTTIKTGDITFDLRRWMAKGGTGGFALDVDSILVDSNGDVLSDSNGNVLVESA